jgi:hypothetical protein
VSSWPSTQRRPAFEQCHQMRFLPVVQLGQLAAHERASSGAYRVGQTRTVSDPRSDAVVTCCQVLPCGATWQQVGSTAASKGAEIGQYADLPAQTLEGPVGLEPTTYGYRVAESCSQCLQSAVSCVVG